MTSLRKFISGAVVALAIGLGAGAANASPISLTIPTDTTANSAVEEARHFYPGHGRLCYLPFRRLVHIFGYYRALKIWYRCHHFGGHYPYGY